MPVKASWPLEMSRQDNRGNVVNEYLINMSQGLLRVKHCCEGCLEGL